MKRIVSLLIASLLLAAPVMITSSAQAASDREEVEVRLELNQCTADELVATGAVSAELAAKVIELREQLGSFQAYEDLEELEIPEEEFLQLKYNTTISGIAADCNC